MENQSFLLNDLTITFYLPSFSMKKKVLIENRGMFSATIRKSIRTECTHSDFYIQVQDRFIETSDYVQLFPTKSN